MKNLIRSTAYMVMIFCSTLFSLNAQNCIDGPATIGLGDTETYCAGDLPAGVTNLTWEVYGDLTITSNSEDCITVQSTGCGTGLVVLCYNIRPISTEPFPKLGDEAPSSGKCYFEVKTPIAECCGIDCNCVPELQSFFICDGGGGNGGKGEVNIAFDPAICDRTNVDHIDWYLNGATFLNPPLAGMNQGTTQGPGSGFPIEALYSCENDLLIYVEATVHFNNGCPSVKVTQDVEPTSVPSGKINVFPNPVISTSNSLDIELDLPTFEHGTNVQMIIVDFHTGKQLYMQDVLSQQSIQRVEIQQLENHKLLEVIITKEGRPVLSSKVLVE